jgi:capsular polysaccharide biosynthesis protein
MKSNVPRIAGIVLSLIGISLLAYGVHLAIAPNIYQSTVRIKAEKEEFHAPNFDAKSGSVPFGDWSIVPEFERMQSKSILYPVISNLNLNKTWAGKLKSERELRTDETYKILKSRMDARQARNTSLITISMRSEDQQEAAKIANALAEEYRRNRVAAKEATEIAEAISEEYHRNLETAAQNKAVRTNAPSPQNLEQKANPLDLGLPVHSPPPVEIIDRAEPSLHPVYPNKYKMGAAFCLGTVSLAFGLELFRKGNPVSGGDGE